MYGISLPNLSSIIAENAQLPAIFFRDVVFPRSDKPCKNTFVLIGTVLKKSDFLGPSRDAQNVGELTKGGTVLTVPNSP